MSEFITNEHVHATQREDRPHRESVESLSAVEDATRKRLAAEAASRAKTEFLAQVSHEIRNPIGVMIGFAELLAADDVSHSERRQYVSTILRNGKNVLAIINDLLDISKIEAGAFQLNLSDVELAHFIGEVVQEMSYEASRRGIDLHYRIDSRTVRCLKTDPGRLRQVLVNLLSNAIKFTAHGSVLLIVGPPEGSDADCAGSVVEFAVHDTGSGIDKEKQTRLFKPYSQGDTTTSGRFGGTGLGLTVSRRLAQALGGDLFLRESTVGMGSTFVARLPVRP